MSELLHRATSFRIDALESQPGGRVKIRARLPRTGVFNHQRGDTKIRESRPDAEVFSEDSLRTLEGAFVTIDHPQVPPKGVAVGRVLSVDVDPPYVSGVLQVEDERAAKMIENGHLKELSCGYNMRLEESSSDEYEFVQTQIRYDHAALLPQGSGRLGRDVCLRLDSNNHQVMYMTDTNEETQTELPLVTEEPAISEQLAAIVARLDKMETARQDAQPEPTRYEKINKTPTAEEIEAKIEERVVDAVDLEIRSREAYSAVYPDEHWMGKKPLGRDLCAKVIQHRDSAYRIGNESMRDLVIRAEDVAATALRERNDAKEPERNALSRALHGIPPQTLASQSSGLREKILNK